MAVVLSCSFLSSQGQQLSTPADSIVNTNAKGDPVLLGTDTLFLIPLSVGPVSSKERADAVGRRLIELIEKKETIDSSKFQVSVYSGGYYFLYEDDILMALTNQDIEF